MNIYKVTLTFTEPLLGGVPLAEDIYRDYIQSRHPSAQGADEIETLTMAEDMEKGMTGFHRLEDGTPLLYDYVLKGFAKDACGMLRRDGDSASSKIKAYKQVIDGMMFVEPRRIPLLVNGEETVTTRPLRADTAQGPRVALASSQTVPAGSSLTFKLLVVGNVITGVLLREWFTYGQLRGLGQWRNASYGRFEAVIVKESAE
jgi:hypothetical protein